MSDTTPTTPAQLVFRFHGDLNFFLPRDRHEQSLSVAYTGRTSVKDAIEARGVPHPEVALILVNGAPVDFAYAVQAGDQIEVYPADLAATMPFPPLLPPPAPRFVLDQHLGRLAERLRLLGFDTLYRNDYHDPEQAQIAHDERRILLTRDLGLLKRSAVIYGAFVRATDPEEQVIEIVRRWNLFDALAPFQRCMRCNGLLEQVSKAEVADKLLPQTRADHSEFHRCTGCAQIYWPGSHFASMQHFVEQIQQARPNTPSDRTPPKP